MRLPGRPPVFDDAKQQIFLRLVASGFTAEAAARHVGVGLSTVRHRARQNPAFEAAFRRSKAEAIPGLLETIRGAGQRSWRASAWLLERLRPSDFGRRVALGPDPNSAPPPAKPGEIDVDEMVKNLMRQLRFSREGQALARHYLQQLEAELEAWDAGGKVYDEEYQKRGGRPNVFDPPEEDDDDDPPSDNSQNNSQNNAQNNSQNNVQESAQESAQPQPGPPARITSAPETANVNNSPAETQSSEAQPQLTEDITTIDEHPLPSNCGAFNP
jgi:hypothetical protein